MRKTERTTFRFRPRVLKLLKMAADATEKSAADVLEDCILSQIESVRRRELSHRGIETSPADDAAFTAQVVAAKREAKKLDP